MKILFFDTETTGLPAWKGSPDHPGQPDIIQLAAILADETGQIFHELSTIINPTEYNPLWKMNPFAEAAHGITTEVVLIEGTCGTLVIPEFMQLVDQADLIICHNVPFDRFLIRTALCRQGLHELDKALLSKDYYCTMNSSTMLCNLKQKNGKTPKWPKLMELHEFLFLEPFEDAHDALNDVRATMRCYFELKERGL